MKGTKAHFFMECPQWNFLRARKVSLSLTLYNPLESFAFSQLLKEQNQCFLGLDTKRGGTNGEIGKRRFMLGVYEGVVIGNCSDVVSDFMRILEYP